METYSKGRQRSIYIKDDIWRDMKVVAQESGRSLSQYISWLHIDRRRGPMRPQPLPEVNPSPMFVESEELDRNPDKYPYGTIGITDPEKSVKKSDSDTDYHFPEKAKKKPAVIVEGSDIILHESEADHGSLKGLSDSEYPGPSSEKPVKEAVIVNIEEPKEVGESSGTRDDFFRPHSKAHQTRKSKRG